MKLSRPHTLKEISALIKCKFVGDPNHKITGINEIHSVEDGDIVFVDHKKYYEKAVNSNATTIIADKKIKYPKNKALIISNNPFDDYNYLCTHFSPLKKHTKTVGLNCTIDKSAHLYPNVFIGNNVFIGKNSIIHSGVCIYDNCVIEDNVIIGPNSIIGHYAFYYKKKENDYNRMHSTGSVHLENNVEIGALCTIDAGVSSITKIGEGSKLDNQVHIGHDTVIGKNCLMAANVGIAGCVQIKDNVTLWGQVGCTSNVIIEENVVVGAQSGISKSLKAGKTYFGSPCSEIRFKYKEMAAIKKLPELIELLKNG